MTTDEHAATIESMKSLLQAKSDELKVARRVAEAYRDLYIGSLSGRWDPEVVLSR